MLREAEPEIARRRHAVATFWVAFFRPNLTIALLLQRGSRMRSILFLFIVALAVNARSQSFFSLTQGQSLSFAFVRSDMQLGYSGPPISGPIGSLDAAYHSDLLTGNERLRVELFENSLQDPPSYVTTLVGSSDPSFVVSSPGLWGDFQGAARLTMESGSIDMYMVRASVSVPCVDFSCIYVTDFVPVPEPTSLFPLVASVLIFGAHRARRARPPVR
jgi:hypothetical protein